jgi:hypothetical protein
MANPDPPEPSTDGPDRWRNMERLFHRAMDLPEAARMDFLDAEAGADVSLRADLMALLDADADAPRRLDHVVEAAITSWLRTPRR